MRYTEIFHTPAKFLGQIMGAGKRGYARSPAALLTGTAHARSLRRGRNQPHRSRLAHHGCGGWELLAKLQRPSGGGYRHDAGAHHGAEPSGQRNHPSTPNQFLSPA